MSTFMLPFIVKVLNVKFFSNATTKFLRKAFWDTITEREEKNIQKEDILQALIQLKNEDAKQNGAEQRNRKSEETARDDALGKLTRRLLLLVSGSK